METKKAYATPQLTVYGDVRKITLLNDHSGAVDVPRGTPVGVNGVCS